MMTKHAPANMAAEVSSDACPGCGGDVILEFDQRDAVRVSCDCGDALAAA